MSETINRKTAFPRLILALALALSVPVLLMLLAGDGRWVEGWVFTGWWIGLTFTPIFYLYFTDPATLYQQYQILGAPNQSWSERLISAGLVIGFLDWLALMPLEARRFYYTAGFPDWLQWVGVVALVISTYFVLDAYDIISHLASLVRLQDKPETQAVSDGVYGFVRHPMYLGASLFFIGGPLLLVSIYGLLAGLVMILLMAVRITGEEELLARELKGYDDYRQHTKYRLIPGIW
jgi:protein-S-isoprenylcysteine O-methyltransferase Ste14